MLHIRLLTAAVLCTVLIYSISYSNSVVFPIVLVMLFLFSAGAEFVGIRWHTIDGFNHIEFPRPPMRKEHFGIGAAYAITLPAYWLGEIFIGSARNGGALTVIAWITLCMISGCGFFYRREMDLEIATHKLMNGLAGFVYLALPCVLFVKLSQVAIPGAPQGIALYFAAAAVFMGDTGGYISGRMLGKHKLIPKVSPKKTIEGSIGGLVFSGLTGIGMAWYFHLPFHLLTAGIVAVLSGAAGQIGDLAESALKRAANCKDSGSLLPGHGGVLDRIDAVLFGIPITYLMFINYV